MIRAIFFDLGGVLVTDMFPLFESYVSGLSKKSFSEVREVRKRYWKDFELGFIDGEKFMGSIIADLDLKSSPRELLDKSCSFIKLKQDVLDVVVALRKSGKYDLGVITNNSFEWFAYSKDVLGLKDYFDVMVSSSDEGIKKPDSQIYFRAAARIGRKPSECLFIDNTELNISGAVFAGMSGIVFRNSAQLADDLRNLDIVF